MLEVSLEEFLGARWQITDAMCDADRRDAYGTTTLAAAVTNLADGAPVHFVFNLQWEALPIHYGPGDSSWNLTVLAAAPTAPQTPVRIVGDDPEEATTWAELFTDDWLLDDLLLAGVWESYTRHEFVNECLEVYHA